MPISDHICCFSPSLNDHLASLNGCKTGVENEFEHRTLGLIKMKRKDTKFIYHVPLPEVKQHL